jgi:SAM-dependent methyltransferase
VHGGSPVGAVDELGRRGPALVAGKAFCTVRMRETVGWARELLGGNANLLENNVGRFVTTWVVRKKYGMNPRALRLLYETLSRIGLNPSLEAADVPDTWIVPFVEGPQRLEPGRALDLGCGAGRNTRYLIRHGWDVIGIDMLGPAIDKARSQVVVTAAKARFLQGDVTRLVDLDIGGGFSLIVDSGCYHGLSGDQRDSYTAGVTRVAAPEALLLMAGFMKILGLVAGISGLGPAVSRSAASS